MTSHQSDTIEMAHVLRVIMRSWHAVAAFTALGVMAAIAVILFAPRRFTESATVLIKPDVAGGTSSLVSQVTGLSDVTNGLISGRSTLETEIGVMQSRAVVGAVVDSLRLQARIYSVNRTPAADILVRLDAPNAFEPRKLKFVASGAPQRYRVEGPGAAAEMIVGQPFDAGVGTLTFAGPSLPREFEVMLRDREDAITRSVKRLSVSKLKGDIASVKYTADDSLTAARVPNLLLHVYLTRRRTIDRGVNQRRVEFLTAKSDSMEREFVAAAQLLRRQQEAAGVLDPAAVARVELESSAALQEKLTDVLVEQSALQQLLQQIGSRTATPRQLAAYPTFLKSPAVNNLVVQLSDLETRRSQLLSSRTETDRDVVALEESIRRVEAQLLPFAETYASALSAQRKRLEGSADSISRALAALPKAAESATKLQRDVLDLAKMSAGLQAQLVEAKLAAIGEGGDVRPLDVGVPPKKPSFPQPLMTAGIGTVGGFLCGLVAALLVGSLGRWVRDPLELERTTGVPTIQFDPATPLLLGHGVARTLVVAPIVPGLSVANVVTRLAQTASWRSVSAAVLALDDASPDINGSIRRLEADHDLVIVQLDSLVSDTAAAVLESGRPVLLVTPGARTERRRVVSAVELLKRLEIPCAGIVMSSPERPVAIKGGGT